MKSTDKTRLESAAKISKQIDENNLVIIQPTTKSKPVFRFILLGIIASIIAFFALAEYRYQTIVEEQRQAYIKDTPHREAMQELDKAIDEATRSLEGTNIQCISNQRSPNGYICTSQDSISIVEYKWRNAIHVMSKVALTYNSKEDIAHFDYSVKEFRDEFRLTFGRDPIVY